MYGDKSMKQWQQAADKRRAQQEAEQAVDSAARQQLDEAELAAAHHLGLTPVQFLTRKQEQNNDGSD